MKDVIHKVLTILFPLLLCASLCGFNEGNAKDFRSIEDLNNEHVKLEITQEREKSVLFTDVIRNSALYMIVRRSDIALDALAEIDGTASDSGICTPDDVNGRNIALIAGTVFVDAARNHFPDSETMYLNSITDEALAVIRGDADALLTNDVVAASIVEEHSELFALPDCVDKYHASFTTPKTDVGLVLGNEFDAFITPLIENGEVYRILTKWQDVDAIPERPKVTYGTKKLNIAVDANDYPFSYQTADGFEGFNIELIDMFCEAQGYEPIYASAQLTAALAGVQTGTYDMLGIQLIETEERAEVMHFMLPLVEGDIKVIVRKADVSSSLLTEENASAEENASFWDRLVQSFEKNFIRENRWKMLLSGLLITIELSALSAVCGTLLGAFICYLRLRKHIVPRVVAKIYVKIFQGTPIVVLLLVLYYVIFGSTDIKAFTVCVLSFSLDFAAYVSEMMRSGIEAVPEGQKKAALALGYGNAHAFREIIAPQAFRHILPVYRGQLVAMVKMTSIAGYISVEDLTKVSDIIRSRTYEAFFPLICTALVYFLLANLLTSALKLMQRRIDPSNRRRLPKGVQ